MLTLTYLNPLLAIIVGVLILLIPRLLNYFIAIYLIVTGVMGLAAHR
jgi:threonine/homoserine efflux transporter RhtA